MERKSDLPHIGIFVYVCISAVDRFIIDIADYIYIPVAIIAIVLMIMGIVINRKRRSK